MQNPKPYPPILGYNETLERRLKTWWDFNDWTAPGPTGTIVSGWYAEASGTGSSTSGFLAPGTGRVGAVQFHTGTTTTGRAGHMLYNSSSFRFGAGVYTFAADIQLSALSDVTDTYAAYFGFGDTLAAESVDGAYFKYSDAGANPNWYAVTANNSTRTTTDTSTVVVAATWIQLKIIVNAAASSVAFYINGANVANNTANIPTAAGRECSALLNIIKSAGTTARAVNADWTWVHADLNATR